MPSRNFIIAPFAEGVGPLQFPLRKGGGAEGAGVVLRLNNWMTGPLPILAETNCYFSFFFRHRCLELQLRKTSKRTVGRLCVTEPRKKPGAEIKGVCHADLRRHA